MAIIREWLGFGGQDITAGHHGHDHGGGAGGHGHTHGVIDPSLTTSDRGIWAIKWSFVILAITAALQFAVVLLSGSVALLADMIHNVGDATTAIPLWFAFVLARRKPSKMFTYGLGRVEDLAGILIVLIILFSAIVAGYQAISRLIHPQVVSHLGWLAAAGVIGFLGNEIVAVFRIRVGRQMNSAALIADGYHARTDGLTSLAVVLGAVGVWFGYPLADPIIGLMITIAIMGIVWQSAKAVITRALDGVEPGVTAEIRHAAEHVDGINNIAEARARWIGHSLHADIAITVDDALTLPAAMAIARNLKEELIEHVPALRTANVTFAQTAADSIDLPRPSEVGPAHHHAPDPFRFSSDLASGALIIADTPDGERMRLTLDDGMPGLKAKVVISRASEREEILELYPLDGKGMLFQSSTAPAEPHEFSAILCLEGGEKLVSLPFEMREPQGHAH
ncbi:cation diffusion facilitator family transporter [Sphingomonas oligophenolica]|uniref:Cation transporter n=1 Tax=Sphingomonas oligophenolica TaxID=301154 RepID=A0A502C4G8_9SPHN|nr:cation diffusion facilitator family transporter [Sphingomonas oligophenolica]TPG08435.1 cation transporter [Sphingomonas oligophenolica]